MLAKSDIWFKHHGLTMCEVPDEVWLREPLLQTIHQKFPISGGAIIRITPNVVFNWHTDVTRAAGINLKVSGESRSHTLFGNPVDEWNDEFVELEYEFKTFYLFNTQHKHSVINFNDDRYLFSIQFAQTKDEITYKEIYDWCLSEGLFDE